MLAKQVVEKSEATKQQAKELSIEKIEPKKEIKVNHPPSCTLIIPYP